MEKINIFFIFSHAAKTGGGSPIEITHIGSKPAHKKIMELFKDFPTFIGTTDGISTSFFGDKRVLSEKRVLLDEKQEIAEMLREEDELNVHYWKRQKMDQHPCHSSSTSIANAEDLENCEISIISPTSSKRLTNKFKNMKFKN